MTPNEYQRKAMRTATGKCYDATNAALGIAGEAGEVADEVKKFTFQGHDWNPSRVVEELGDVLMQVLFHTDIERAAGHFDIDDVADAACKKLVYRHPHVFRRDEPDAPDWDTIKQRERAQTTTAEAMDSVARSLPALWRCEKIQAKAAKTGFEWPDTDAALDCFEKGLLYAKAYDDLPLTKTHTSFLVRGNVYDKRNTSSITDCNKVLEELDHLVASDSYQQLKDNERMQSLIAAYQPFCGKKTL